MTICAVVNLHVSLHLLQNHKTMYSFIREVAALIGVNNCNKNLAVIYAGEEKKKKN